MGLSNGFMQFSSYVSYSYAFSIGAIWVEYRYWNTFLGREYQAGDSISVFFGVLLGLFSVVGAGPNFKALAEGKTACRMACDIIDRNPTIQANDPQAEKIDLKGEVEFKNVNFFYP